MKKLSIILLSCIYALSVFGMAPALLHCCEDAALINESSIVSNENTTENCCNNPEQGVTNVTHHLGAATVHIAHRHYTTPLQAGMATDAVSVLPPALQRVSFACANSTTVHPVPLYTLHCVYRI